MSYIEIEVIEILHEMLKTFSERFETCDGYGMAIMLGHC